MKPFFIKLSLGNAASFEQYKEVFFESTLYARYFSDDDRLDRVLTEALEKKELWVATADNEVVGVMEVRLTGFFGAFPYLALLGVKKGWRGMGVGHQMIAAFEEAARQLGYPRVSLMVSQFNPRAKNLYQSLGYKKIGYLPDAFKKGNDENIMVKDLV